MADRIDDPEVWRPLTGMPDGAEAWAFPGYREMTRRWLDAKARLKQDGPEGEFMREWLAERARAFAIETGQIEGLYTLKRGVTEQLIAEGFAGVVASHTVESVADRTIRGLLEDQRTAYDMIFADVASGQRLSQHMLRSWHQLMTRHQETVAGLTPAGERVEVEFENKGVWKTRTNNPRRPDGVVHQYCPPGTGAERDGSAFRPVFPASRRATMPRRSRPRGCITGSSAPIRSRTATAACPGSSWPTSTSSGGCRRR